MIARVVAALLLCAPLAAADCRSDAAKASARHAQAVAKTLQ
jgi:hypothetical protein